MRTSLISDFALVQWTLDWLFLPTYKYAKVFFFQLKQYGNPITPVGIKHDGTDRPHVTAYTDGTAGLVADGTDYKDVSAE